MCIRCLWYKAKDGAEIAFLPVMCVIGIMALAIAAVLTH